MSLPIDFRIIFKSCSIVQDRMIVDELNIPRLKFHQQVESWIVRELVQQIKCFDLLRCKWGYTRKAASRLNVLPLVFCRNQALVIIEDRNREIRFSAIRHLTASIRLN